MGASLPPNAQAQPLASGAAEADDAVLSVTLIMPDAADVASNVLKLSKVLGGLDIIMDRAGSATNTPRVTNSV